MLDILYCIPIPEEIEGDIQGYTAHSYLKSLVFDSTKELS